MNRCVVCGEQLESAGHICAPAEPDVLEGEVVERKLLPEFCTSTAEARRWAEMDHVLTSGG